MRRRDIRQQRNAKQSQRQPIQDLGPDYEDEIDIEHQYARELFEHEQAANQKGQQQ